VITVNNMAEHGTPQRMRVSSSVSSMASRLFEDKSQQDDEQSLEEVDRRQTKSQRLINDDALQLDQIRSQLEQDFSDLAFVTGFYSTDKLTITKKEMHFHPPFGYTSRIQVVIKGNEYTANVLVVLQSGSLRNDEEVRELCKMFSDKSSYKFCPGIDWNLYEEQYHEVLRYHPKYVRVSPVPCQRIDSVNCERWYELPSNAPLADKFAKEVIFSACKRMTLIGKKSLPHLKAHLGKQKDRQHLLRLNCLTQGQP